MKLSTDRILTTHTGSLPRAQDLTTALEALDSGRVPDPEAFDARVRRAVGDIVRQQLEAGVDIVNDGEQGKVGYSTYVRHRLTGFDGQAAVPVRADWADFPEAAARGERQPRRLPGATRRRDEGRIRRDPSGGLRAADRLPGPRDGTTPRVPRGEQRGVPEDRRGQHRGTQPRAPRHPGRPHAAPPLLGQLRGAASPGYPAARAPAGRAEGQAPGPVLRGRQSATRARVGRVPRDQIGRA